MNQQSGVQFTATVDEIDRRADGEDIATLAADSGQVMTVPASLLPEGVKVNDVVIVGLRVDPDETERRRSRISNLQNQLFDRS